ncbi:hypothetical protein DPMN_038685 [Dreissena polymorpha]|uniref:Uncharacterized protein n=1 Tax=Dreissena polymorpha TaxID=45954 RepID=A0A9D4MFY7_DREPO|nr:hypothetical protein DPMN_038685 [Dreissena polymorpha]
MTNNDLDIEELHRHIDRDKAYILLQRIMEKKICLVIQDCLDEWRDTKGKLILPLMVECHNKCTSLITTWPWKLADERIRDSQIDGLYLLDGLKDVFTLSRKCVKISAFPLQQRIKKSTCHLQQRIKISSCHLQRLVRIHTCQLQQRVMILACHLQ